MSKKTFVGGLDSLLGETGKKPTKESTPQRVAPALVKSTKEGLAPNETRATFIVDEDLLGKVKALAYWERLHVKEVIAQLLQEGISSYEKRKGKLKPVPDKR